MKNRITSEYLLSIGFVQDLPYNEHRWTKGTIELCDSEGLPESNSKEILPNQFIFTKDDGHILISKAIESIDELNIILPFLQ